MLNTLEQAVITIAKAQVQAQAKNKKVCGYFKSGGNTTQAKN